ncbi:hypothetical protein ACRAWG_06430 [Methylobacterium sp. P31]
MTLNRMRVVLAAAFVLGIPGTALAFDGGGDSGSGLNPYAELSGNGRTGGVNSGNYLPPKYNTYLHAYGPYRPRGRPVREHDRSAKRPSYGRPY